MSIVLAPVGQVATVFGASLGRWQPFDPQNPRELLKLAKYGIDYSAYLTVIKPQWVKCRGSRPCNVEFSKSSAKSTTSTLSLLPVGIFVVAEQREIGIRKSDHDRK